jgi:hypothetical protein
MILAPKKILFFASSVIPYRMAGLVSYFAAKLSNEEGPLRSVKARYVLDLLKDPCVYCQEPANSLDHILALSLGGSRTSWSNLAPACTKCNSRKGQLLLLDFLIVQAVGGPRRTKRQWRLLRAELPPPRPLFYRPFETMGTMGIVGQEQPQL